MLGADCTADGIRTRQGAHEVSCRTSYPLVGGSAQISVELPRNSGPHHYCLEKHVQMNGARLATCLLLREDIGRFCKARCVVHEKPGSKGAHRSDGYNPMQPRTEGR